MSFVPQKGDAQVNLAVLGGLVTNMPASSLPEGVSPDNQDVVYAVNTAQGNTPYIGGDGTGAITVFYEVATL